MRKFFVLHQDFWLDNRDLNTPTLSSKLNVEFPFNAYWDWPEIVCLRKHRGKFQVSKEELRFILGYSHGLNYSPLSGQCYLLVMVHRTTIDILLHSFGDMRFIPMLPSKLY